MTGKAIDYSTKEVSFYKLICNDLNIHAVAYIRGEQPKELNTVLQFAKSKNMELNFISRADYDLKNSSSFIQAIHLKYPDGDILVFLNG